MTLRLSSRCHGSDVLDAAGQLLDITVKALSIVGKHEHLDAVCFRYHLEAGSTFFLNRPRLHDDRPSSRTCDQSVNQSKKE